ncbi:protein kintoun [Lacerta agilis]|uniref:protein kintoun n=1 Tax=Lacerta agilis TaxID=80427 RepID=UPI00141A3E46|nr:protein kintoun [Lacerta agilis]
MAGRSSLEDLDLTGDEVERLTKAFQDEGFRKLFADYAAELSDPAQRAVYEAEVSALERQRGVEARFLHPEPGWVLRTSQAGSRRCYVNVCGNGLVARPESRPEPGGSRWSLPHCLAPAREELGSRRPGEPRGPPRLVYDVLFHPDALRLAARSARFRRLVSDTALEAVESHFSPGLDRANAVPLRGTKYKGVPQATLLRTPLPGGAPATGTGEDEEESCCSSSPLPPFPTPYAYPPRPAQPPPRPTPEPAPAATTPRWTLRQRSYVDLQDYRCSRDSAPSPVPRELVVTVELPCLSSAAQAQLEVRGRELQLESRRPAAAYSLRVPLPYAVDEAAGKATFNKAKRQLVVVLPVLLPPAETEEKGSPGCSEQGRQEEEEEREEEEEEPPPPLSETGGSAAPGEPQLGCAPIRAANNAEQAPLAAHVEARPGCAAESGPAAPEPGSSTCPGNNHSDGPRSPGASSPEAPAESDRAASARGEDTRPTVPTCAGTDGSSSGAPVLPAARREDPCVDSTVELPGPVAGVSQGHLCTDMDLNESTHVISDVVPSPYPGGIVAPPRVSRCDSLDQSVATLSGLDCSNVDEDRMSSTRSELPVPPACPSTTSNVQISVPASPCPVNITSGSPLLPTEGPTVDPDSAKSPTSCLDSPVPPASTATRCPPFQCTQDENSLRLILQVPGIVPQSLRGEVGTNCYRVSFASKDFASYTLLLQFPPENRLSPPEFGLDVSLDNAVIALTKSLETTGLWRKMYFGPNDDSLQERWFVTEDNVDEFLDSLSGMSRSSPSEMEHQPLIEVLDVSEGKSQIRLKPLEQNGFELGKMQEKATPKGEDGEQENGSELSADAESCPAQTAPLTSMETMGQVGGGPGHCLELDPSNPSLASPGKQQIRECRESKCAFAREEERATSTPQAQFNWEEPGQTRGGEGVHPESAQNKQGQGGSSSSRPAPPVLKETDMRDGSVQYITSHTTHCAVAFQNALLYELD